MTKTKEAKWTNRKLMYKDGNVDVYRYFNWETWKRLTADERAMWTESSEATPAPISKEVIDFKEKEAEKSPEHKDKTRDLSDEKLRKQEAAWEKEKVAIKVELKELEVRFAYNAGLDNLREKLAKAKADADNPE